MAWEELPRAVELCKWRWVSRKENHPLIPKLTCNILKQAVNRASRIPVCSGSQTSSSSNHNLETVPHLLFLPSTTILQASLIVLYRLPFSCLYMSLYLRHPDIFHQELPFRIFTPYLQSSFMTTKHPFNLKPLCRHFSYPFALFQTWFSWATFQTWVTFLLKGRLFLPHFMSTRLACTDVSLWLLSHYILYSCAKPFLWWGFLPFSHSL